MGIRSAKGDGGMTSLLSSLRVSKDSDEVHAIGDLDELNSYLGLVKAISKSKKQKNTIETLQRGVCIAASEISISAEDKKKHGLLFKKSLADTAQTILFEVEDKVRLGHEFYIPGDNELSAHFDVARTIARRAERSVVAYFEKSKYANDNILVYLNCLSDILFVMARTAGQKRGKRSRSRG